MATYDVVYRLERGETWESGRFIDVSATADHVPQMGAVVQMQDGSGRYGRVIAVSAKPPGRRASGRSGCDSTSMIAVKRPRNKTA